MTIDKTQTPLRKGTFRRDREMERKTSRNRRIFLFLRLLLLPAAPLAWGVQQWASSYPQWVEQNYSMSFYPVVVGAISRFFGLFPFSVAEIFVILMVLATPVLVFLWIRHGIRAKKHTRIPAFLNPLLTLAVIVSVWYAAGVLLWNLQYSRVPLSVLTGLPVEAVEAEVLRETCEWLALEANTAREDVMQDENDVMRLTLPVRDTLHAGPEGYEILSKRFPFLMGRYGRPKPVLLSRLMSWSRIVGLYTVTTAEANIDVDITPAEIPFVTLHELAHQRGIAREDEANATAWLAGRVHPNPDYRYSAALQTWIYASNALRGADRDAWSETYGLLSDEVRRDLAAQSAYWSAFDSIVDKVAEKANDAWLKTHGQEDGVKSYGRMVDLVIAEYRRLNLDASSQMHQ